MVHKPTASRQEDLSQPQVLPQKSTPAGGREGTEPHLPGHNVLGA